VGGTTKIMKTSFHSQLPAAAFLSFQLALRSLLVLGFALATLLAGNSAQARTRGFPIPTGSQPISITMGADGNFWFTLQNSSQVARITPQGVITEFRTPTFSFPFDITPGPDGNLWFTEQQGGKIGRITTNGVITEFGNALGSPRSITDGPDGNVWFTLSFTPQIGRITPAGDITLFPIPHNPEMIARGNGNYLLFTEFGFNKFAQITIAGVVTESPEFPHSQPTGITAGTRRSVWFLGYGNNKVYSTTVLR
jgi:streptogramin lyase